MSNLISEYELTLLMKAGKKQGWNDALEAAAQFMESRKVSASSFYATELRKMKNE